jgi:hypothetical protein
MFSYCRLVWMSQVNVPVVLLDPCNNGTASLPNVNLTTFAVYAVHAWSFRAQVAFHGPKEAINFPRRKAHRFDVVPGQHTADAIESRVKNGRKATEVGVSGMVVTLRWIESPSYQPVTVLLKVMTS